MIVKFNLFNFEGNDVEVLNLEGKILFNPEDIAHILEIKNVRDIMGGMNNNQVIKLKESDVEKIKFKKSYNIGENFITESGVVQLIMISNKPEARKIRDWIIDEVIPSISKKGKDLVENKIEEVARDNKENALISKIKKILNIFLG